MAHCPGLPGTHPTPRLELTYVGQQRKCQGTPAEDGHRGAQSMHT